jgi:DNA polymerase III delta' subunit
MAFKNIAGNIRVKKILKMALERDRIPNSLLFTGPEGIGKRQMALALAKALNCREAAADSCDSCPSCRAIEAGRFPDVMTIPDADRDILIDEIRFLKQVAFLKPMAGRKRVFILNRADSMNADAANSLLKVLEEPPSFSHFILLTDRPYLLLPTIVSRCQTLAFSAVRKEEIEKILVERDYPPDQARILSLLVDGNLERALELDWDEVQALKDEAWKIFEAMLAGSRPSLFLDRFGSLSKSSEGEFEETLQIFSSFARDMLLLQLGGDARFLLNPDFEGDLRTAAAALSVDRSLELLAEMDSVLSLLPRSLNRNLLASAFLSSFGEISHV